MASYNIVWKQSAEKELKKLNKSAIPKILQVVESLASVPHPAGSRKLHGSEHLFRIRMGDYRVVYSVENRLLIIEIIRVGHRKDVYRKFQ